MSKLPIHALLPKRTHAGRLDAAAIRVAPLVIETAALDPADVYARLATQVGGLTESRAAELLAEHGPNALARDERPSFARLLGRAVLNPLVILLAVLATASFVSADAAAAIVMLLMIVLSLALKLVQETRAGSSAAKLRAMISVHATARRDGRTREVPIAELVPGDVIELAAGDMVPGDVRIVQAKDLFVSQGSLTGESIPIEKHASQAGAAPTSPLEFAAIAFLGTSVESGSATAVVVATGNHTYLGSMAASLQVEPPATAFDRDISRFTWLLLKFMLVMVPIVFVINGLTKGSWRDAFFFALAVAVGLTPEMLPMIVAVCLAKGAVAMGKKQVIVKRLDAIQNLGAMDVLCTDKTGTLTQDRVVLERYCDLALRDSEAVLALAYTNSHFQTGLKNALDRAVLAHEATHAHARVPDLVRIDEIPFDFQRRIMSVVVRTPAGKDMIISKGAPEAIFSRCVSFELDGARRPLDAARVEDMKREYDRLSADGFRVLALATKEAEPRVGGPGGAVAYGAADERDLVLQGYVAFLDPPKPSCSAAIAALRSHGVLVKVITGDNEVVARKVCRDVGLTVDAVLLGADVERMTDEQLAGAAEATALFARVSPAHKQRIIKALQARKHVVGFMGDGINDAPALHAADVGISVDTAVDIAKAAADMILLEQSLLVLDEGVLEGRKVFANISKYIRMGASSNFGNMFSVLGASILVPFLPMLPIQILANNLLYDLGQASIPTDNVDPELIQNPRPWDIKALTRFILFIGPCSSIFDYTTYFVMLYGFGCWDVSTAAVAAHSASVFQTGWFVESLVTQGIIIHVIRTNKIPFLQSRASRSVMAVGLLVIGVGVGLPFTPVGRYLGLTALPPTYHALLILTAACYLVLTQSVKSWLLRRHWI